MKAYLSENAKFEFNPETNKHEFFVEYMEVKTKPLLWQEKGLQYTASGYGSKIPTQFMVKHGKQWKRVYCRIYSNIGTLYIKAGKEMLIVQIDN